MSTIQEPPEIREEPPRPDTDGATLAALTEIRRDVHEQSRSIRRTQQGFVIFAAMALLIALASLIAVAAKLNGKPQAIVQRPAAPAASTAHLTCQLISASATILCRAAASAT